MANLKDVIYLSNADYNTLISTGTVTINGTTLTYDENNIYMTPEEEATTSQAGLMSAADKTKLDSLVGGTYVRYDTASQGLTTTQKSNARTNIGAGTSNLTLGGNGSATTASHSDHTHTTTLATDTGTSSITLAHDGKYKLTAGGNSVVFTMPSDNNTTYTFATGTSDGNIQVTPSGGSAQQVAVKGLQAAAYRQVATSISSSSDDSHLATAKAVYDAIEALPEPMVFKGSVGTGGTVTWANLPSAASTNIGWTYKVITDHTADTKVPTCKVGDTIISTGSEWAVIPSGDEPSGTVTSVGVSVPTGLSVSGTPVTSSGTIAITYANGYSIPTTTKQSEWDGKQDALATQTAYTSKGSSTKVPQITTNALGQVTNITEVTITDNNDNQTVKGNGTPFTSNAAVNIVGGGIVTVTGEGDQNKITISASHQGIKSLDTTATTAQSTSSSEAIAGSGTIKLHKVAKTGTYSDLIGTPTIPTVNNATLTIQKNGTTVNTFTANSSTDVTANITVPTTLDDISDGTTRKLSDYLPLTGGTLTGSSDPVLTIKRGGTTQGGAFIRYYNNGQSTNYWRVGMFADGAYKWQYNGSDKAVLGTDGTLLLNNSTPLSAKDTNGTAYQLIKATSGDNVAINTNRLGNTLFYTHIRPDSDDASLIDVGTSTYQWRNMYSTKYTVNNKITMQYNSTEDCLDFVFSQ